MDKKLCFVIMGFGKKTDPFTGRVLDLDKTYENIIAPAVLESGLECIRADEIHDSGLIDKSMYALLIHADLVIADISTFNFNAVYELGIRHAVRPFSTIILKENEAGNIPFDLSHNRIFSYNHEGADISATESKRCTDALISLISQIMTAKNIDSPMYEYIKGLNAPLLPEDELRDIIDRLGKEEKFVFVQREKARNYMKMNLFSEAEECWRKAATISGNDDYFIQQQALCRYKSENPNPKQALLDAWAIISQLNPDGDTLDPETLGIAGAINKNLFRQGCGMEFLDNAIKYYQKSFVVSNNYYTGENYAHCILLKSELVDKEERIYCQFEAKRVWTKIIENLSKMVILEEKRSDQHWMYATLSNCFLAIADEIQTKFYEEKFYNENPEKWEVDSFLKNRSEIISYG